MSSEESHADTVSGHSFNESSDSDEAVAEFGGIFEPYQHEPLASSTDDSSNDEAEGEDNPEDVDGIRPSQLRSQFEGQIALDEWCSCTKCSTESLVSAREYRCCREINEACGKMTLDGSADIYNCITEHDSCKALVHKEVLLLAGSYFKGKTGRQYKQRAGVPENEYLRAVAYRWLIRWLFGYLGWDKRRVLPACMYTFVREMYPTTSPKTGFKDSAEQQ